ncbi:hypothetical protein [Acinetobacter baumannii]|uniref:hypothetical protein n=2 Tax=Acinetobacter baumannii TaxID=470 RepID=UPI003891AE73
MDKFNEWFDSKYPNLSANQDNEFCKTAKDFAYVAFQHQQAKVDELQKRVDAAQKLIDDWNCGGVHIFDLLDELEQALKGEGQ